MLVWAGGALSGCEKPDWSDPAYLRQQLAEGDRLKALDEVGKLPEAKQREMVPALVDLYKQDKDKDKVFTILAPLRDPQAKDVYVAAMKDAPTNREKAASALALGDIQAKDQIPAMLTAFQSVPNEDLRRAILESFAAMPDASQIPLLTEILTKYDPDSEPIAYHSYACDVLLAIGQFAPPTVEALVYGMYLDNAKGQNVYKECATAVLAAGKQATPALIKVLKGENEAIKLRFAKYPSFVEGSLEIKVADVLGLLRDPAAVDPLLEALQANKIAPVHYRDDKLLSFAQNRIQFFVFATSALGDIGDPKALELLEKTAKLDKDAIKPYQAMLDYDKRSKHDIVQASVSAIQKIGDREKGLPLLAEVAQKGDIPELAKYGNPAFAYQTRWEAALEYAQLAPGSKLEEFDKLIAQEKVEDVKKKMEGYKGMLEVAKECDGQAACFERHLKGTDKDKARKSAWELGRMEPGGAAEASLIEGGLKSSDLELRLISLAGLYKVGGAKSVEAIDALIQEEKDRRGPEYKDVHFKMRAVRAFLKNKQG